MSKTIDPARIVPCAIHPSKTFYDLTGRRFDRWFVASFAGRRASDKQYMWCCTCACGATGVVTGAALRSGRSRSCGCFRAEYFSRVKTTHGMTKTPEYQTWSGILARCLNPNGPAWGNYGGRGITVCDRWLKFENFFADMGRKPSVMHTLERLNNDGPYDPSNCRWATYTQQNRNRRSNHNLTFGGVTMCIAAWSSRLGFRSGLIWDRLERGWSVADALTRPVSTKHRPFPPRPLSANHQ